MYHIFDLDGTLVDSLTGIAAALNHALKSKSLPVHPEETVRSFIGKGSLELVRQAMPAGSPDTLAHELDDDFKTSYAEQWRTGSMLYPGIERLIHQLHSDGHKIAVLSNKPEVFTREIVEHFFPGGMFGQVLGHSPKFPRKPEPDAAQHLLKQWNIAPFEARFIGDSDIDRMTAENANIPFVGVSWGYHHADGLGDQIADSVEALAGFLRD